MSQGADRWEASDPPRLGLASCCATWALRSSFWAGRELRVGSGSPIPLRDSLWEPSWQ